VKRRNVNELRLRFSNREGQTVRGAVVTHTASTHTQAKHTHRVGTVDVEPARRCQKSDTGGKGRKIFRHQGGCCGGHVRLGG